MRLVGALISAAVTLCACTTIAVPTSPDTYNISPAAVRHLRGPQSLTLRNAWPAEAPATIPLPKYDRVVSIEQMQLTDTAIVMLARALATQGIARADQSGKVVTLRVRPRGLDLDVIPAAGKVLLEAQLGDGTLISLQHEGRSIDFKYAFDRGVFNALSDLLRDGRFVAYMNR